MLQLPQMYVTTDAVTFSWSRDEGLRILLIRRASAPFPDSWALPGGFVEEEEDLIDACVRELREETGVEAAAMVQIGAWGKPGRDPRGRNVSIAYLAVARPDAAAQAGSDAKAVAWHPARDLPRLAFDHSKIAAGGMAKLQSVARETHLVFALLPQPFGREDLRGVLADVTGELVTMQEAGDLAKRARIVKEKGVGAREVELYRCVVPNFLAPLR